MNSTQDRLKAICAEILKLDVEEVLSCLPEYHRRLEDFDSIQEWEEATLMFFLINGLRIKNIQLQEKLAWLDSPERAGKRKKTQAPGCANPLLKLVK